jgi:hypothetical protein
MNLKCVRLKLADLKTARQVIDYKNRTVNVAEHDTLRPGSICLPPVKVLQIGFRTCQSI